MMPTNAEELPDSFLDQLCAECEWEYGEKVVGKQTLWRIVSELQARRALNNSKPTPAVGNDGLIETKPVGWISDYDILGLVELGADRATIARSQSPCFNTPLYEAASALAAAHSQHDADVATIGVLTEALRPFDDFAEYLEVETEGFSDSDEIHLTTEDGFLLHRLKVADFRRARSVLAGVKP